MDLVPDPSRLSVSEVVAEFRRILRDGDRDPKRVGPLVGLLGDLHRTNISQWSLEDDGRRPGVNDATIARAKRAIDALNTTRHHLIEAIDAGIDAATPQAPAAPPVTESPGMVLDRLSVLVIRIYHTELAAGPEPSDTDPYGARLPVLHRQLATLEEALEALLRDVRAGRRRFLPYQHLKLYAP
jgi:hypothetical protein